MGRGIGTWFPVLLFDIGGEGVDVWRFEEDGKELVGRKEFLVCVGGSVWGSSARRVSRHQKL